MSRTTSLVIAALLGMALNMIGIFVFDRKPLTATELLLLIFMSAWAGEKTIQSDTAQGGKL